MKESIERKEINELVQIEGKRMLADYSTKEGASSKNLLKVMRTDRKEDVKVKS